MIFCEKCIHYNVCGLEGAHNEDDARVLTYCDEFTDKSTYFKLPCPLGSTVYRVVPPCQHRYYSHETKCMHRPCGAYVEKIKFCLYMIDDIGKTVFLTEEDAQKILEEEDYETV